MKIFVLNHREYELRESGQPNAPNYWNHQDGKLRHFWLIDRSQNLKLMGISAVDENQAMSYVAEYTHYLSQDIIK
jgi:hypothetical protein